MQNRKTRKSKKSWVTKCKKKEGSRITNWEICDTRFFAGAITDPFLFILWPICDSIFWTTRKPPGNHPGHKFRKLESVTSPGNSCGAGKQSFLGFVTPDGLGHIFSGLMTLHFWYFGVFDAGCSAPILGNGIPCKTSGALKARRSAEYGCPWCTVILVRSYSL